MEEPFVVEVFTTARADPVEFEVPLAMQEGVLVGRGRAWSTRPLATGCPPLRRGLRTASLRMPGRARATITPSDAWMLDLACAAYIRGLRTAEPAEHPSPRDDAPLRSPTREGQRWAPDRCCEWTVGVREDVRYLSIGARLDESFRCDVHAHDSLSLERGPARCLYQRTEPSEVAV